MEEKKWILVPSIGWIKITDADENDQFFSSDQMCKDFNSHGVDLEVIFSTVSAVYIAF